MDATERRNIERECSDLVVALTHYGDHHQHEAAVDLFTPDGTWIRGGKPYTGTRRDAGCRSTAVRPRTSSGTSPRTSASTSRTTARPRA